jgi:hypothetical protein
MSEYEDNKDSSPSEPVDISAGGEDTPDAEETVEDPSTPAHEVVEETHQEQAENTVD